MAPRIKWNRGALYHIRSKEPAVVAELDKLAEGIAGKANLGLKKPGYKTSSVQGKRKPQGRWRTTVITATAEAMRDNTKHNTLLKALFRG